MREWTNADPTAERAWRCSQIGRLLSKALRRTNSTIERIPFDGDLERRARQLHRRPYIYSEGEVRLLFETARSFPFAAIAASATDDLHHAGLGLLRRASPWRDDSSERRRHLSE